MMQRWFRSSQNRIDSRDLPLADDEVFQLSHELPMQPGGVRGMNHEIIIHGVAVGLVEQLPGAVEKVSSHLLVKLQFRHFLRLVHRMESEMPEATPNVNRQRKPLLRFKKAG